MSGKDIFSEIPDLNYSEQAESVNLAEFKKVIESRRSVRVYSDEKVPEEAVRSCLDMALKAPNSSNLQPWEFYWVRSEEKKKKLVEACLGQPAAATAQELIVAVARRDSWKKHAKMMLDEFDKQKETKTPQAAVEYYKKLVPIAYTQGPFGILGLLKRIFFFFVGFFKVVPRGPASIADMRIWAHKSTALACENLMLAIRAHGYDSCPMEGLDASRVSKILGLKGKAEVCMAISMGKRDQKGVYGPQIRFDKKNFLFEV
jgi:nitroreductase